MPDEECHGVTLDERESISHWTRVGQSPHKLIPTAPVAKPPGVTPRWAMNDQSLAPVTSNGGLRYPLKVRPEPGQAIEVAPGVQWLRMPLPMALNHINLWAPEDGNGWGYQIEGALSYRVNEALSVGVGGRYWRTEAKGFTHFENHVVGFAAVPQVLQWKTDNFGVFFQSSLKLGPYPLFGSY